MHHFAGSGAPPTAVWLHQPAKISTPPILHVQIPAKRCDHSEMSGVAIPEQRRSHSDTNRVTLYNGWAAKADIHTGKRDSIDVAVDLSLRLDDAAFDGGEFPEIPESIAEIRLKNLAGHRFARYFVIKAGQVFRRKIFSANFAFVVALQKAVDE